MVVKGSSMIAGPRIAWPGDRRGPVVHWRGDEAAAEEGLAGAEPRADTAAAREPRQCRFALDRDGLQAQSAQDRLLVAAGVGVQLLVQGVEALDRLGERARRHRAGPRGQGHRHVEGLARVAERRHALEAESALAAAAGEGCPRRLLHLREQAVDARQVHLADGRHVGAHLVDHVVGEEQTEGRERGRQLRDEDATDAELGCLHARVQRTVAAEDDQREAARVDAAARRRFADGVRHVGVHQPEDALGGLDHRQLERLRDARAHRGVGALGVEPHGAAGEAIGIQVAEHDVRVGDGRLDAAAAIAHRTRLGARALRSHPQGARLDACNRPAAGADRLDVDHRQTDQVAMMPVPAGPHLGLAAADQADVVARTAHVDGDEVAHAGRAGDGRRAHHAARRPRAHDRDGLLGDVSARHDTAVRLHDEQLATESGLAQAVVEAAQVALDLRADVGIHERRAGALELRRGGHHLVRQRHHHTRQLLGRQLAHPALVRRIDE